MYGTLAAMLVGNAVLVRTSAFSVLAENVAKDANRTMADNGALVNQAFNFAKMKGLEERMRPYCQKMDDVHKQCLAMSLKLDSISLLLANPTVSVGAIPARSTQHNSCTWTRTIFKEKNAITALLNNIDGLRRFLIGSIDSSNTQTQLWLNEKFELDWDTPCSDYPVDCNAQMTRQIWNSTPAVATALLAYLRQNIARAEKDILGELYREGRPGCIFTFDAVTTLALPNTGVVLPGQKITASVFIGEFERSMRFTLSQSEGRILMNENGIATWRNIASNIGPHHVRGNAFVKRDSGTVRIPWAFDYQVGPAYAGLQSGKSNILYRGIPNPVTIQTASCFEPSRLSLVAEGATVEKTDDAHLTIRVKSPRAAALTAFIVYNGSNGKDTIAGMIMRVASLPVPVAAAEDLPPGKVTRTALLQALSLRLYTSDSLLQNPFMLRSYTLTRVPRKGTDSAVSIRNIKSTPGSLGAYTDISDLIRGAAPGDRIMFEDITATGPDEKLIDVAPVCYIIE